MLYGFLILLNLGQAVKRADYCQHCRDLRDEIQRQSLLYRCYNFLWKLFLAICVLNFVDMIIIIVLHDYLNCFSIFLHCTAFFINLFTFLLGYARIPCHFVDPISAFDVEEGEPSAVPGALPTTREVVQGEMLGRNQNQDQSQSREQDQTSNPNQSQNQNGQSTFDVPSLKLQTSMTFLFHEKCLRPDKILPARFFEDEDRRGTFIWKDPSIIISFTSHIPEDHLLAQQVIDGAITQDIKEEFEVQVNMISTLASERKMEEESFCIICMENFNDDDHIASYQCGHYLHRLCLLEWTTHQAKCPICRRSSGIKKYRIVDPNMDDWGEMIVSLDDS